MRTRTLAALAAAAAIVSGCASADADSGAAAPLSWEGDPVVVRQPQLPDDTVVSGRILNGTDKPVALDARSVTIVRADGSPVRATVTFAEGYSHSLYPPRDAPKETPRQESERLGRAVTIAPGKSAHLTVAWRIPHGSAPPVKIDLGVEKLALP